MKFVALAISSTILLADNTQAFVPLGFGSAGVARASVLSSFRSAPLFASSIPEDFGKNVDASNDPNSEQILKLKSMAQKLRAEAAALEANRQEELASAAQKAFRRFDTNGDGKITFDELKLGLERALKEVDLPDRRIQKLMSKYDASGDGALQIEEFVPVEEFRNQLEALTREERRRSNLDSKKAQEEEETSKMIQAVTNMINDKQPTSTDRVVSVLPYLFPLLDVLPFGQNILLSNSENPLVMALAAILGLYRSVPFAGFVAFFALSYFSGDVSINRLVRFNMKQAIYLDIALFFPTLVASAVALLVGLTGNQVQLPEAVTLLSSSAIFFTVLAAVAYSVTSSLAGVTPDKVPFLSDSVNVQMPSQEMIIEAVKSKRLDLPSEKEHDKDTDKDEKNQ